MDQTAYFEKMRQKRRTEILHAARQLVLEHGLHAFTMQQLARSLDISTVTLYKYFKNSEDVMEALQQHALQSCSVSGILLPSSDDPLKDFFEICLYCFDQLEAHRPDIALIVLTGSYLQSRDLPAKTIPALPYPADFYQKQLRLLEAARQNGQLSPSVVLPDTLQMMNRILDSVLRQMSLLPDEAFPDREELRRQAREMIFMFRACLTTEQQV